MGYINLFGMDVAIENINNLKDTGIKTEVAGVYTEVKEEYKNFFDVVFLNAVLEHLLFPKVAINNIKNYLKRNGKIVIVVPDMKLIGSGNTHPSHHFHHEHINYFSILSLDRLMYNEGFSRVCYENILEQSDLETLMVVTYERTTTIKKSEIIDTISEPAIIEYIEEQKKQIILIEDQLFDVQNKGIILWGVGARMFQTIATTKLQYMNIEQCVDGNSARWNSKLVINNKEYTIKSPESVIKEINEEAVIVICCNSKQYELEIGDKIRMMGLENRLLFL